MNTEIRTDYLVLRKTPYGESSLVVAGLSAEQGQLHFLVKGGRSIRRTSAPVADLFRVLRLVYREGRSDLCHWRSAEVAEDYGGLARNLDCYTAAGWLARFVLLNSCLGGECPELFTAVCTALRVLADTAAGGHKATGTAPSVKFGVCLVYLAENGLLPHHGDGTAEGERVGLMLEVALGRRARPELPAEKWQELLAWSANLLAAAECRMPAQGKPAATPG
jgi:hypothetical protein